MVRNRLIRLGLIAAFGGAIGCATSRGPDLKTPMPEQYNLPPADDARFSQPVDFPKEVLNQEPVKAPSPTGKPGNGGPGGGGMMPAGGMGRGPTPGGF
jgi:hypothetical protein